MAKKKKEESLLDKLKNTVSNATNSVKDTISDLFDGDNKKSTPSKSTSSSAKNTTKKINTTNTSSAKNISVPRPTTTLNNATKKVLSTPKITPKSTVKKPTSTAANTPTIKSSSLPTVSSNPKVQKMAENSTQWNRLEAQKNLLLKQNPNQNVSALTNKQNLLHKNNTDLGLDLGLKFTPSGSWTNSSGNKAYDIGTTNNGYISPVSPMALLTQLNGAMPKSTQQIAAEGQARQFNAINESASESLKNAGQWLKDNTIAGVTGASAALTKTADLLLPNIPYLQDYFEWNANYADEQKAKATETNSKGGNASNIVGEIYQAGVQMIPSAVAALASGGSSTASQIGQAGSSVASLLQSPAYWTSFAQTAGPEYYNAKAKGANELQASLTGMTSGAVGGAIERMGGIDTFLGNKAQGVIRTAAEEAGEEVLQDITSGLINKTVYDHEREWVGTGDSDAVINPQRLAMNAAAGAILGGAVSGINAAINGRANANNNTIADAKQAINNPDNAVVDVKIDGQSVNDIEVPTLRTVAENHINKTIAKAQNAQNASMLSNQPLQNNTSVNVENMTSITPLQVPTLRTVAENHINEVIAQNATNSQPSAQTQTVGQIIDNAITDSQANTNKSKIDIDETSSETITNDLLASWQEVKALDKQIAAFEERVKFTGNDLRQIESSLLSGDTSTLYRADNPQDALYMVELKAKRNAARQPIDEYKRQYQDNLWLEATEDAEMFFKYAKDKIFGLQYATETPERNIYDIFGKKFRAYAEDFIKRYYVPVHKAVAKGNQLKNKFRDRVRSLNLTQEESVLTQYLLEGKTEDYNQYISSRKIKLSKEQNLKISKAVAEFREIYDELFRMINEAEVRNGLEPTDFRQFYAPHFTEKLSDHILARALNRLGFNITQKDQIPTSISGITEMRQPKKQYFKHLQRRTGDQTVVDAVRGFDQYIDTACDVITLTDSIQRFRQLEDAIRYQFTDASMKKAVEKVMADDTLSYLQRQQKLDEIYENNTSNAERINNLSGGNMGLRNFVAQLRKYTDNLAGKKSRGDRSIEDDTNRTVYEVSKQVQSRVSANMIAGNISSWLTNVIPLTQATGEIDLPDLFRGMRDTIRAYIKDDGFVDGSAFLTNRRGSKNILQTKVQKVGDILGTPMEIIDHFVADSIVRARTHQNIKKGMDYNAAIDEADAMAASLMADRSKGATPEIFNRQDPKVKLFTTFQIEVNNQLRYLGKDIPRRLGEQGAVAVGKALTSIFVGAYLYNELYEKLTGRRAALDPVGMIKDTLNIIDNEETENSDKIQNTATLYAQQLPFVGGLLGGGRLPISAALPDVGNLLTAFNSNVPTKKRVDIIAGELANPAAYLLLPFGGGAIKKGIEGFNLIHNKGAYRVNDDGEDELMFAANGNAPTDYLQAMLFGKYSGENGQNYINSGFKVLSSDYTKMYKQLVNTYGVNNNTAYDSLMNIYTTQAKAGGERKPNQRLALMNSNLPAEAKEHIDRFLFRSNSDENIIDYSDKAHFDITMNVKHKYLDNALYLHDELGVDGDATVKLIRNSMFGSTDNLGKKNEQIYTIIDNINKMNVSDDIKNYAFSEIVAPQISEKYVSEQGKQLLSGIPMDLALTSYYQRDIINEEINNDNTIHPADKKDYQKIAWTNYLDEYSTEFGLSFEQKENLRYFLSNGQSDFEHDWDYYAMKGSDNVRPLVEQFKNSGLDVLKYQVIRSGMEQIFSDKNADGTPVKDSKKRKLIAYLDQWGLDDNMKNLMLMADDYKYGLYEKPSSSKKKSSSSKKSSGGRNSKPKVKGGFSDFSGF